MRALGNASKLGDKRKMKKRTTIIYLIIFLITMLGIPLLSFII